MTRKRSGPARWANHTVTAEEAGETVEAILKGPMGLSGRMLQRLTRNQGIRLNRGPAFLGRKVKAGDEVSARVAEEEESGLDPVPMELEILHEDADLLVVNKPPGLLVHPVSPQHRRTLAHGLAHHFQAQGLRTKIRPVHRLDRDTSGLLLVAKTAVTHQKLDLQLREDEIGREYLALVRGAMEEEQGTIDVPIGAHPSQRNLRAVRPGGDPARTRFRVRERYRDATLVELALETGRTHQIRVHLSHRGHPLLGDRAYGGPPAPPLRRQALHAFRLRFLHPATGDLLAFEASLPEDMETLRLRLESREPPRE